MKNLDVLATIIIIIAICTIVLIQENKRLWNRKFVLIQENKRLWKQKQKK